MVMIVPHIRPHHAPQPYSNLVITVIIMLTPFDLVVYTTFIPPARGFWIVAHATKEKANGNNSSKSWTSTVYGI